MLLSEAVEMLDAALLNDDCQYSLTQKHYAIQQAIEEMIGRTTVSQQTVDLTLTVEAAELDISTQLSTFRDELFLGARIGPVDRGTWADSTAYVLDDYVIGDGSPDTKKYLCTTAHTSSASEEPPNTSYWTEVVWKSQEPIKHVDFRWLSELLNETSTFGKPEFIAMKGTTAYFYPPPDKAYTLTMDWKQPLPNFVSGTLEKVDISFVPDEYLRMAVSWGAAVFLSISDPGTRGGDSRWRHYETELARVAGRTIGPKTVMANRADRLNSDSGRSPNGQPQQRIYNNPIER